MGCQQRVYSQAIHPCNGRFNPQMNEHARLMRVRYNLFDQPIPSSAVGALDAVAKSVLLDIRNRTLEVALLFMEERFPVRDEELHITHLWTIDRGVIDFVQNAVR